MARYIENLNACTDPVSGDYLWIVDASAGSTDKDRKVDAAEFAIVDRANTFAGANTFTGAQTFSGGLNSLCTNNLAYMLYASGSDSHTTYLSRFVRRIPLVSSGTKLIIPVLSQSDWTARSLLSIQCLSAAANYSLPLAAGCRLAFASLTTITQFAAYDTWGNYSSAAVNGMNIEITFTTAYTGGSLGQAIVVNIEYLAMAHRSDIITWNSIALN